MPDSRQHVHAHLHAQSRTRERRQRLAHEAARLMAEGGIRDFQMAKRKAAQRLGILDDASLPRNHEIEEALRQYQRLFLGDRQPAEVHRRREAALRALEFFAGFQPRLVGPVLEGTADARSPVDLHLHSDDPDAVPRWLDEHGIPAQPAPAARPGTRAGRTGLAVQRGGAGVRGHRVATGRPAAGAAVWRRRAADAARLGGAAAHTAGRGGNPRARGPTHRSVTTASARPIPATPCKRKRPSRGVFRRDMRRWLSACPCPRSRAGPNRYRSGAGGRCGSPGLPAAPASG